MSGLMPAGRSHSLGGFEVPKEPTPPVQARQISSKSCDIGQSQGFGYGLPKDNHQLGYRDMQLCELSAASPSGCQCVSLAHCIRT